MTDLQTLAALNPGLDPRRVRLLLDLVREHSRHAFEESRKWGGKHVTAANYHLAVALTAIQKIPAAVSPGAAPLSTTVPEFPTVDVAALKCTTSLLTVLRAG